MSQRFADSKAFEFLVFATIAIGLVWGVTDCVQQPSPPRQSPTPTLTSAKEQLFLERMQRQQSAEDDLRRHLASVCSDYPSAEACQQNQRP
jgi:hypothetical protein